MYDTLRPSLLTATEQEKHALAQDPTNVVNIEMFKRNQFPYLEVINDINIIGLRD